MKKRRLRDAESPTLCQRWNLNSGLFSSKSHNSLQCAPWVVHSNRNRNGFLVKQPLTGEQTVVQTVVSSGHNVCPSASYPLPKPLVYVS